MDRASLLPLCRMRALKKVMLYTGRMVRSAVSKYFFQVTDFPPTRLLKSRLNL